MLSMYLVDRLPKVALCPGTTSYPESSSRPVAQPILPPTSDQLAPPATPPGAPELPVLVFFGWCVSPSPRTSRTLGPSPAGERWQCLRCFPDSVLEFVDLFFCVFIVVPCRTEVVQFECEFHPFVYFCEFECSNLPIYLRRSRFSIGF